MSPIHRHSRPPRVLIVDDHPIVCRTIRRHLEQDQEFAVCGVVQEAAGVNRALEDLEPDVVLLDLKLGDDDGLAVARSIRTTRGALPILMLSIHEESLFAKPALNAGANGYLMKSDASEDLFTALHTVLEGQIYLSPDLSEHADH